MFRSILLLLIAFPLVAAEVSRVADAPPYESFVIEAREAQRKGLLGKSLEALDKAIKLDPNRVAAHFFRGQVLAAQRKPEESIAAYSKVIELDPKASSAYEGRAEEKFKLAQFKESAADFDRYVELEPKRMPYCWQRGIALYYAGRYADGRRQFELHQTVNPNDVENAVWHFLCVAREDGFDKARSSLISISSDTRVPMAEIYDLFRGKATEQDVLNATQKGNPSEVELDSRKFYTQLYVGLFYDAKGDKEKTYEHIKSAATDFVADHYMGDVARAHFKKLVGAASAK